MDYDIINGEEIRDLLIDLESKVSKIELGNLIRTSIRFELVRFRYEHPNLKDLIDMIDGEDNHPEYEVVKPHLYRILKKIYEEISTRDIRGPSY